MYMYPSLLQSAYSSLHSTGTNPFDCEDLYLQTGYVERSEDSAKSFRSLLLVPALPILINNKKNMHQTKFWWRLTSYNGKPPLGTAPWYLGPRYT